MAPTEEPAETAAAELESKLKVGEEDGEEVDEVVEGAEGEASAAAKKKKKKKKKKKTGGNGAAGSGAAGQTSPPTVPVSKLFNNVFPEGEIQSYATTTSGARPPRRSASSSAWRRTCTTRFVSALRSTARFASTSTVGSSPA